jgi:DNA mismatch repair ATPase MutL
LRDADFTTGKANKTDNLNPNEEEEQNMNSNKTSKISPKSSSNSKKSSSNANNDEEKNMNSNKPSNISSKSENSKKSSSKSSSGGGSDMNLKCLWIIVCLLAIILVIFIIVFSVLFSRRPENDEIEKTNYNRQQLKIENGGKFGELYSKENRVGIRTDNPEYALDVYGDMKAYGDIHGNNVMVMDKLGSSIGLVAGVGQRLFVDKFGKVAFNHYNNSEILTSSLSVNGTSTLGSLNMGADEDVNIKANNLNNIGSLDMKLGPKDLLQGNACVGKSFQVDKSGNIFFCKAGLLQKICC